MLIIQFAYGKASLRAPSRSIAVIVVIITAINIITAIIIIAAATIAATTTTTAITKGDETRHETRRSEDETDRNETRRDEARRDETRDGTRRDKMIHMRNCCTDDIYQFIDPPCRLFKHRRRRTKFTWISLMHMVDAHVRCTNSSFRFSSYIRYIANNDQ